ncbi:hypothetical protein HanPI659440_Chr13g0519111 [Helianthus annuus]|nr:hypothetical protein HanPI659440_Chr13g0519111 [Helianthus annuus]
MYELSFLQVFFVTVTYHMAGIVYLSHIKILHQDKYCLWMDTNEEWYFGESQIENLVVDLMLGFIKKMF